MTTLQKICGSGGTAPIVDSFTYQNDILIGSMVHKIEVNNNSENLLPPTPDFTFESISGTITRPGNAWVVGDKLIVWYSKCKCDC